MSDIFETVERHLVSWWRAATATRFRRLLLTLLVLLPIFRIVTIELVDWERKRAAGAAGQRELLRPGGVEPPSFEGSWVRFSYPPDWTLQEERGDGHELARLRSQAGDGLLIVEASRAGAPQSEIAYALRTYQQEEGCERGWDIGDWGGLRGYGYGLDCPDGSTLVLFEIGGAPPVRIHQRWTPASWEVVNAASYMVQQTLKRR